MPGPRGRPTLTVSPDVSECRRMPESRRRVTVAAKPCPASCTIVIPCRRRRQSGCQSTAAATSTPADEEVERRPAPATTARDAGDERGEHRRDGVHGVGDAAS